jgi:hypothetical protein
MEYTVIYADSPHMTSSEMNALAKNGWKFVGTYQLGCDGVAGCDTCIIMERPRPTTEENRS